MRWSVRFNVLVCKALWSATSSCLDSSTWSNWDSFSTTTISRIRWDLLLDGTNRWAYNVVIALILLWTYEWGTRCSPVSTCVLSISYSTIKFYGLLMLHLRLILHSLETVPMLSSVLDALVDVPHIDCLELEPLCLAVCPTSSSSLVLWDVNFLWPWRLASLRRYNCVVVRCRHCVLLLVDIELVIAYLTLTLNIRKPYRCLIWMIGQTTTVSMLAL